MSFFAPVAQYGFIKLYQFSGGSADRDVLFEFVPLDRL
jgi:hypothetical protein